ncbi:hypothetical protein TNCV_2862481 [Trichonephila clavipes]|nr:hypothetical protein TNCV_2862481 [Trichonephila clavipes]
MNRCPNTELADIHFNENGRVAVRLQGKRYPRRRLPNNQTFSRVHQNLAEHGSFRATIDDTLVKSEMYLVARISLAAATIHKTSDIFEYVSQSMSRQCRACIHANGSNFKHLMRFFNAILFVYFHLYNKAFYIIVTLMSLYFFISLGLGFRPRFPM